MSRKGPDELLLNGGEVDALLSAANGHPRTDHRSPITDHRSLITDH